MRTVAPRTGAPEETIAEEQPDYLPITVGKYAVPPHMETALLTRWILTTEERQQVANGEDIYLMVLTFGQPLQPLQMQVGPEGYLVRPIVNGTLPIIGEPPGSGEPPPPKIPKYG